MVDQVGGRKNLARLVEAKIREGQALALAGLAGRQVPASAQLPAAAE
jgi:hypothetical protein